jgi:hypothetical protein
MQEFQVPELRDFSADEIRNIVQIAQAMKGGTPESRLERMRNAYPDFWYRYPKLLDMSCQPGMDMRQLEFMLQRMVNVEQKVTTLEHANKEIQEKLTEAYIPQNLRHDEK